MCDPEQVLAWLEHYVKPMRQSRHKTLAVIIAAALRMKSVGMLALGRAMAGALEAKHTVSAYGVFSATPMLNTSR
ncbi:MAG: hypothetical protein GXP49_02975 [Deltaproteobacteria bacterium]|nr:hypothetical protein [Deltaproteobacteria bacterium]